MHCFRLILPLPALLAIFVAFLLPHASGAEAAGDETRIARAEKILNTMLKALVAGDYPAFLAPGTKDLSDRISEQRFAVIREDAAPALKPSFTATYDIDVLEKDGTRSYHWKIIPRKGDTELRAILTLKGEQVYNLSVQ